MKFSIIIPVLNAERTLKACLTSVTTLDYPADQYEVLCVDNGSTDGSISIIQTFKTIRLIYEHNRQSSYAARNTGILAAQGELIAFTDADCIVPSNWLSQFEQAFSDSLVGAVAGQILPVEPKTFIERYQVSRRTLDLEVLSFFPFRWLPVTANAAYRRSIFSEIGLFRADLTSCGDFELGQRIKERSSCTIAVRLDITVRHHHRTSFQAMVRQHKRYGIGRRHMDDLKVFPEPVTYPHCNPFLYAGLYFLKSLWLSLKTLFSPWYKGPRLTEFQFLWLDYINELTMRIAYTRAPKIMPVETKAKP